MQCHKNFQSKAQPQRLAQTIWRQFVWERRTLKLLCQDYGKSKGWIRKQLKQAKVNIKPIPPQPTILIIDATFFKRTFGVIVARSALCKKNILYKEIYSETIVEYWLMRIKLEQRGFTIKAVIMDGRPGARKVFSDLPTQMCHYHQKAIINRYLTTRPKLEAGIELGSLTAKLTHTNQKEFSQKLNDWHAKWSDFLKERTRDYFNPRKWHYTHQRLRAAYRSLTTNLPYLFTYQQYPSLKIPNTTNGLDGYFSHLKELTKIHRGLHRTIKKKMIDEILGK